MLVFENTIEIQKPLEEVFSFVADFENVPRWNYYVTAVRRLSPGPIAEGTRFAQQRKTDRQQFTVTAYEPHRRIAVKTTPESRPQLAMDFELEPVEGGTRLRDRWELETGLPALVERITSGQVQTAVAQNLEKLKELLETGRTQLQDGRFETR